MIKPLTLTFLIAVAFSSVIVADQSLSLSIYSNNFAMVKDTKFVYFDKGQSRLALNGISPNIQLQTVNLKPLKDPESIRLLEQELYNGNNYPDQSVKIMPNSPNLIWKVWSERPQTTPCQFSYRATGFNWKVDYSLVLNKDENKADIGAWVAIENTSGKKYSNAKIKLISGEANIFAAPQNQYRRQPVFYGMMASAAPPPSVQFNQQQFGDFYTYTLNRLVSLQISSKKQFQFFPKKFNIPVNKIYEIPINVGGNTQKNLKVKSTIQFTNSRRSGLGDPFPQGIVRMYRQDESDNSTQFIGQDRINHIAQLQPINLKSGFATDIVAEKVAKSYKSIDKNGSYDAVLFMKVSNKKNIKVDVIVIMNNVHGDNISIKINEGMMMPERPQAYQYRWRKTLQPKQIWEIEWREYRDVS